MPWPQGRWNETVVEVRVQTRTNTTNWLPDFQISWIHGLSWLHNYENCLHKQCIYHHTLLFRLLSTIIPGSLCRAPIVVVWIWFYSNRLPPSPLMSSASRYISIFIGLQSVGPISDTLYFLRKRWDIFITSIVARDIGVVIHPFRIQGTVYVANTMP